MGRADSLGQFEQLVLTAILTLRDDAYGVTIHAKVQELAHPKAVSLGAVYVTLDRMEDKGYVASWLSDPTPERGGRAKRCYRLPNECGTPCPRSGAGNWVSGAGVGARRCADETATACRGRGYASHTACLPRTRAGRFAGALHIVMAVPARCLEHSSGCHLQPVRRTTDPQLLVMEAFALLLTFLAVWILQGAWSTADQMVLRVAIPAITIEVTFVLAQAYAALGRTATPHVLLRAGFAVAVGFLSQAVLLAANPLLTLPPSTLFPCAGASVLLLSALRAVFPSRQETLQPAGGAAIPSRDGGERTEQLRRMLWRGNVSLWLGTIVLMGMGVVACLERRWVDRVSGALMIAIALYVAWQVLRKGHAEGESATRESLRSLIRTAGTILCRSHSCR